MRLSATLAIAILVGGCADLATAPTRAPESAALARGDNPNAPIAVFNVQLRPEFERPAPTTSTAWGKAQIKIYSTGVIEWKIQIHNPDHENIFAGHIHVITMANGTGPIRQTLHNTATTDDHLVIRGSASNPTLAAAILANPTLYYVNFHTPQFPGGSIRGDLP